MHLGMPEKIEREDQGQTLHCRQEETRESRGRQDRGSKGDQW